MIKKNENGYVFIITLLALVLLSVLGLGIMTVSSNSLKTSTSERSNQSLFYLAEAGINYKEAIILDRINTIYEEEKLNPANQTNSETTFNNKFNTRIKDLLDSEYSSNLDESYFLNKANGKPNVKIDIIQNGSPRNFTIKSEAKLANNSITKTVRRDYEIPSNLLTVIQEEVPVTSGNNSSNEPPVNGKAPTTDYRIIKGKVFVEDITMSLVSKSNNNAEYSVPFKYQWYSTPIKITYNSNIDLMKFNQTLPNRPGKNITFVNAPNTPNEPSGTINLSEPSTVMKQDLKMVSLPNFSNKIININIPSGERNLVFTKSFLDYNFSSLRFNVTGAGKLNIVFNKYFTLNSNTKFIVNAPDTTVNLIFKNGASIRGEMNVQDMFINGHFETTLNGKLIANNLYIPDGTFDKDMISQIKINHLYIKKGNLNLSSPSAFYANTIVLDDGKIIMNTGSHLTAQNIFVMNGSLRSHLTTCVQADKIVVPNNTTRFDNQANFNEYHGKDLYMISASEINKSLCGNAPVTISPEVVDETPQTTLKNHYNFKEFTIEQGNLVEIH